MPRPLTSLFTALFLVALLLTGTLYQRAAQAEAETTSIPVAVVDLRYLLQKAPQSDEASRILKARFLPQEKILEAEGLAIRKLEEELTRDQGVLEREVIINREREIRNRKRAQNRALEDYREDLRLAREDALEQVQKQVFEAINQVREANNIDVVIQDYVSASERVDITRDVLEFLRDQLKRSKQQKAAQDKG